MARNLSRLLRPRSIAVIGGGAWCAHVIGQCRKARFAGPVWPVHPKATAVAGEPAFADLDALPAPPDAVFIGVNRRATVEVVARLAGMGAGGAVCFASGFREAAAEDADGTALQDALLAAAGEMPILGPNCYGFINYLDGALLWPDQHGGTRVERGAAIVTQSSNIAINLTMQARALPLSYVVTAGNQAQTGLAEIGAAVLDDPRVTALGLHIEGVGDLRALEALAVKARTMKKPVVALKVGRSAQARAATVSHTASLAGEDAGADALLRRLGIARLDDLPVFLETLKLLHANGWLASDRIATVSCSGGEASLAADTAVGRAVRFPALTETQKTDLRAALGPMVALANPLDYHTYIWRDTEAMATAFAAMMDPGLAMTMLIVDFPRADRCDPADWDCTIEAAIAARARTGRPLAMVATLPELMPEPVAARLLDAGVVPFSGLTEAIAACAAAQPPGAGAPPLLLPGPASGGATRLVSEAEAKTRLAAHGLRVPAAHRAATPEDAGAVAEAIGGAVALKGEGVAHKTEAGAVRLNLRGRSEVTHTARAMPCDSFLVEEMITGGVVELLVGVVRDPAHGFLMTLAAGGTLTELMDDHAAFLLPATDAMIHGALDSLRIAPMLAGYRGAPPADRPAILRAVRAVEAYVIANADTVEEIEINPLICTPRDAVAADALIREGEPT